MVPVLSVILVFHFSGTYVIPSKGPTGQAPSKIFKDGPCHTNWASEHQEGQGSFEQEEEEEGNPQSAMNLAVQEADHKLQGHMQRRGDPAKRHGLNNVRSCWRRWKFLSSLPSNRSHGSHMHCTNAAPRRSVQLLLETLKVNNLFEKHKAACVHEVMAARTQPNQRVAFHWDLMCWLRVMSLECHISLKSLCDALFWIPPPCLPSLVKNPYSMLSRDCFAEFKFLLSQIDSQQFLDSSNPSHPVCPACPKVWLALNCQKVLRVLYEGPICSVSFMLLLFIVISFPF
ncbi:hypothetical protein BSL78_27377 [Apostichopus japonicus]|uniref:Uncharacterized protein n=1 Tax=Stichopus japonicus TaxID=307972 RepID=A0A2G8JJ70_STIJA|nr:hypothetical protein BSL78_27377 [Apostichopus japonicus]